MAANTLWCFLVPLVVVICTASAASITSEEEFVRPIPLTEATNLERRPRCPSKERWDECGALCQRNCTNFNDLPGVCPLACVPGCLCEPGYVRGANGRCVKSKECPGSKRCPRGERYDQCSYLCQKNCTNYQSNEPCTLSCHPGCVCPEGYVRSVFPSGKCIKVEKCPKRAEEDMFWREEDLSEENSTKEDEDYDDSEDIYDALEEGSFCPKNEEFVKCESKTEPDCGNTPPFKLVCVAGCRCKSGYTRGPRGACIIKCPEKNKTHYPVQRICPRHEYWDKDNAHCQKNCTHPQELPCVRFSVPGCICTRGFQRRDDGKCVPKRQCPKTIESEQSWEDQQPKSHCPPNEFFAACIGHCEPDCKNKSKTLQDCNRSVCVSECKCLWGFVRGPKGDCIKPDKCPANDKTKYPVKRKCPANEQWETNRAHCQTNCTTLDKKISCSKIAVAGCVCKKDNYRNKKGECVPKKQCTKKAEEFDVSTEDDLETDMSTEEPSWLRTTDDDHDEKLWRNDDDDDAKAKSYCPPNEFFAACIGHCEPDCKNKSKTLQDCNRSVCVSECKCLWGFVRGPKGDCIKPDKCPANDKTKYPVKRKCPANEQWETSRAHCQTNCTTLGKTISCTKIAVAGCVCKKDNYRNKKGECVPKKQCAKKAEEIDVSTDDDLTSEFSTEEPSRLHRNGDDDLVENRDVNDERDEVLEAPGGCPNDRKCTHYCRDQGKKYGRCVGRHRRRCTCRI